MPSIGRLLNRSRKNSKPKLDNVGTASARTKHLRILRGVVRFSRCALIRSLSFAVLTHYFLALTPLTPHNQRDQKSFRAGERNGGQRTRKILAPRRQNLSHDRADQSAASGERGTRAAAGDSALRQQS